MGAQRAAFDGANPPTTAEVEKQFRDQGHTPQTWSNGTDTVYEWHDHAYHKAAVLYVRPDHLPHRRG